MKFIEELTFGDCFVLNNNSYIITTDFKKNNDRLCVSLTDGSARWFAENTVIEQIQIYTLDKENNLIPFKEVSKDAVTQNSNVS